MALTAALVMGGLTAAGGIASSAMGAASQREANAINAQAAAGNRDAQLIQSLLATINNSRNMVQQGVDNERYDEAVARENAQRQFTNRASTASQVDADGNITQYDPVTGTWRVVQTGLAGTNADRRRTMQGNDYQTALVNAVVNGRAALDRASQGARHQGNERALAETLLARYAGNQGRSPESLEAAMIEANVAKAMDPLTSAGSQTLLAGYRQGNSGNDALLGALARGGNAGTRSAIADARLAAPSEAINERDATTKALLGPATTLASRGTADPGVGAPVFSGDSGSNLLASLNRPNPAGVGTTISPQRGTQAAIPGIGNVGGWTPLNATGNQIAGATQSLQNLYGVLKDSGLFAARGNPQTYNPATALAGPPREFDTSMLF